MCPTAFKAEFSSLLEVADYFKDQKTCLEYLESTHWNGEVHCPFKGCGCKKIYRFSDGRRLKCSGCKEYFSLRTGTIFQDSNIPLRKWYMAMYLMINNTRGISSYQLARQIGVTQKTAWFMGHRIRKTFKQDEEKLSGMVAMDEAFVGGRNANRHIHKKVKNNNDRTFVDKVTVIGMLSAQKGLKCYMIKTTRNHHLQSAVRLNVESGSHIITDEWKGYQGFYEGEYTHSTVNHSARKFYSEDGLSTNGVENVWSNLKKMMMGTYNWVSRRHFQKYMDEFTFRYNNRKNKESINFGSLLKKVNHSYPYKLLKYGEDQERTYTYQDGRESEYRGSTPAYLHASEKEGEEGKERVRKNIQLLKILAPHLLERHKKHLPKKD